MAEGREWGQLEEEYFIYEKDMGDGFEIVCLAEKSEIASGMEIYLKAYGIWLLCSHGRLYGRLERDRTRRAFYAQCTHIDYSIRLLLGTLREQGILEDTIIGFTSDHGEMLFQHEMVGKRCFYEPSARVPFLLWGEDERLKGGREIETLACLGDIMPTLLDLCQIPIPNQVEGISLVKETARPYLYGEVGEDTGWIEKEVWKGEDFGDYGFRFDPSLNNQRGLHWPQP